MKQEQTKYNSDIKKVTGKIKENKDKIKMNIQLPWLVSNVLEILDVDPEDDEDLQDFGGA